MDDGDDEPANVTIKRAPSGQSKPRPGGSAFDSSARKGKVCVRARARASVLGAVAR